MTRWWLPRPPSGLHPPQRVLATRWTVPPASFWPPPTSRLTPHHHHQPVTSPHPTATTCHVTSPTFSNRAGKTKKGRPATLFLFQVCSAPHYPCLAHQTHVCIVVRVFD